MYDLDRDYREILKHCLRFAREASREPTLARVQQEIEHLHEIPGLIGDANVLRHYDYLKRIRGAYLGWLRENRPELEAAVVSQLQPIWQRMADHITPLLKDGRW
jgi:hypothetical protein